MTYFINNINLLNSLYRELWWNSSAELNLDLHFSDYWNKIRNEKLFNTQVDTFVNHINKFPEDINKRLEWKHGFYNLIDSAVYKNEMLKLGILDETMKDEFITSTKDFIKKCKSLDKTLRYEDIGQALRNVWIVNIFQKTLNLPMKLSDAISGYSLLYPYTDNFLDDPSIDLTSKKDFNLNFSKRLKGELVDSKKPNEAIIWSLVSDIESVFNRESYPLVYESLLLIHNSQEKSLLQQDAVTIPYERDILSISIEKGGASVLADAYLINGSLTKEEEFFSYGYGFFLQLCDDLQDIKKDLENSHMTIMAQLAGKYPLDSITNKLINLVYTVVDEAECFKYSKSHELKKLIKDNCIQMILFAIVDNREYYSKEYINTIEKYLPFRLSYIKTIKTRLSKKFKSIKPSYYGLSLEEVFLYLLDD